MAQRLNIAGHGPVNVANDVNADKIQNISVSTTAATDGQCLCYNATTELWEPTSGTETDEKVGIDSAATPGYIGAASNDGVLRTGSNLTYTDGGDFVTLDVNVTGDAVGTTDTQTLTNKTLTAPAYTIQTLTDAATIAWDMSSGTDAQVTITADRTLDLPTNIPAGARGFLKVIQDGTGGHQLSYNAVFKWGGDLAPNHDNNAANEYDIVEYFYDGTNMNCSVIYDVH